MASNYVVLERDQPTQGVRELAFAGDGVRLAGQIDYPKTNSHTSSIPLMVVLPHAGCNKRSMSWHYADIALAMGYAVFRWDKRGTGHSGAGGRGSATMDAVLAYETAIEQPRIDPNRVVILAQGDGSRLLLNTYESIAQMLAPAGIILVGNMIEPELITTIKTRLHIIQGEADWNDWKEYARDAVTVHQATYNYGASYYVARNANRFLNVSQGEKGPFHFGAKQQLCEWLNTL